jgi:hypothetical protein
MGPKKDNDILIDSEKILAEGGDEFEDTQQDSKIVELNSETITEINGLSNIFIYNCSACNENESERHRLYLFYNQIKESEPTM